MKHLEHAFVFSFYNQGNSKVTNELFPNSRRSEKPLIGLISQMLNMDSSAPTQSPSSLAIIDVDLCFFNCICTKTPSDLVLQHLPWGIEKQDICGIDLQLD